MEHPNDNSLKIRLKQVVLNHAGKSYYDANLDDQDFQTIKIQLKALGFVEFNYRGTTKRGTALFWSLTKSGAKIMIELRTIRKSG